jgi:hypothetical protein
MGQERMVVLANSKKLGGYCMAGKALDTAGHVGSWMRPVTAAVEDGLPMRRTLCSDGRQAAILDVVTQDWGLPAPALHQRENRLMGPATLQRCGRVAWDDLPALADNATSGLWKNGDSSSCGLNDRVSADLLPHLPGSLLLIATQELVLRRTLGYEGRIKYRAEFGIGVQRYNLALTDTVAIAWLINTPRLVLADAYVCISLAVPFHDGFAYKLATAVITKERAESMT